MAVSELKTQYLVYYRDLAEAMTDTQSVYQKMFTKMTTQFDEWGITQEEKAKLISQTVMTLIPQFEQLAEQSTRELMTLESELPLKDNESLEVVRKTEFYDDQNAEITRKIQHYDVLEEEIGSKITQLNKATDEITRKIQYYDDRLLETVVEKQADLASFAVNANSDSAQDTINDLKAKMGAIEQRVVPVLGNTCPPATPIISIPAGLIVSDESDTTLTIKWLAVSGATSYILYRDGIQIASTGNLSVIDSGLVQLTKYSYNVRTFSGSYYSDLSITKVGTTLVTPVIP